MKPAHCEVPDCTSPILHGNLCKRHYHRLWHEVRRKGRSDVTLEELGKMTIVPHPRTGTSGGTKPGTKAQPLLMGSGRPKGTSIIPGRIITEDDLLEREVEETVNKVYDNPPASLGNGSGFANPTQMIEANRKSTRKENARRRQVIMDAMVVMSDMLKVWIEELKEMDS